MKSWLYISVIAYLSLIVGCSSGIRTVPTRDRSPQISGTPTSDSIHFYTMGEWAYNQGDFLTAYGLFNQADYHDPESRTIKERILETLWILSRDDNSRYHELISLAEGYRNRELDTVNILRYLGLAYLQIGMNEKGLEIIHSTLEMEPNPYNYYDYFIYLIRYANNVDFYYLEKAIELSRNDPEILYAVAQIYEYHNPLRSKEILEKVVQSIGDEESYHRLIDFLKRYGNWSGIIDLIESQLTKGKMVPKEHKTLMLEILLFMEDYDRLLDNYPNYKDYHEIEIIEIFFLAAYNLERYEQAIELGQQLYNISDYTDDKRKMLLATLGELSFLKTDYNQAVDYLLQLNELDLITSAILSIDKSQKNDQDLNKFIDILILKGFDLQKGKYLRARLNISNNQINEGLALLDIIIEERPDDEDLLVSIAVLYLENDLPQKAEAALTNLDNSVFDSNSFIASYYYVTGKDSLSIDYYSRAIENSDLPPSEAFLSLASLFEKRKEHDKEMLIMEKAVLLYPEDPLILNWLGYSLTIHTERYDEAKEFLLKAISLEPDNYFIQDSVAWLYYKLEDYEKALSYMQEIINNGVQDSIVAYHLAMIFYMLSQKDDAIIYLSQAIELNTDEDYKIKAEEKLKELETDYEK